MQSILDDLHLWLIRYTPEGHITYANEPYAGHLGIEKAELTGKPIHTILQRENISPLDPILKNLMPAKECSLYASELIDDLLQWREWRISPVTGAYGKISEYQLVIRDVSDQKMAEAFIRRSAERTEHLLNCSSAVIYSCRASEPLAPTYITRNVKELLGYHQTEFLLNGSFWLGRIHPDDQAMVLKHVIPESGERMVLEYRILHEDGRVLWLRDERRLVVNESGERQIVGAWLDITQRKMGEEKRVELATEVATLEERMRLAHELHDAVHQTLFSSSVIADALTHLRKDDPEQAWQSVEELRRLNRGALAEMRNVLLELRSERLLRLTLSQLLSQLAEAAMGSSTIDIHVRAKAEPEMSPRIRLILYRITQEVLQHILRYSGAKQVEIELEAATNQLVLKIVNDGDHLNEQIQASVQQARQRALEIGASLYLQKARERGSLIEINVPLDNATRIA